MRDHIERLRAKPEHVRRRIAVGASIGATALVGIIWLGTLVTSGTLALNLINPASNLADDGSATVKTATSQTQTNFSQLIGAVGASIGATSTDPSLTVVDSAPAPTPDTNSNPTVIPF